MAQPPFPDTPAPHPAQGWFHLFFLSSGSGAGGAATAVPQNHLLHPPLVQRWGGGATWHQPASNGRPPPSRSPSPAANERPPPPSPAANERPPPPRFSSKESWFKAPPDSPLPPGEGTLYSVRAAVCLWCADLACHDGSLPALSRISPSAAG